MIIKNFAVLSLVVVLVAWPAVALGGPGVFWGIEKGQECSDRESFNVCRNRIEPEAIRRFPGRVARSGVNLTLKLSNGKTKVYKDEAPVLDGSLCGYRFVSYLPEAEFYLVDENCETDHIYRFVSSVDGKTWATGTEYPKTSQDGSKILMMDAYRQLKIPLFQVFVLPKRGYMTFEAKIELKALDGLNWHSGLYSQWQDTHTILIADDEKEHFSKAVLGLARFDGKKWSVSLSSKAIQERKNLMRSDTEIASSLSGKYFMKENGMIGEMSLFILWDAKYEVKIDVTSFHPRLCGYEGIGFYKEGFLIVYDKERPAPLSMKVIGSSIILDSSYDEGTCAIGVTMAGTYTRK